MKPAPPELEIAARRSIHMTAIGGVGMAALAGLLTELGHRVRGSDLAEGVSLPRGSPSPPAPHPQGERGGESPPYGSGTFFRAKGTSIVTALWPEKASLAGSAPLGSRVVST